MRIETIGDATLYNGDCREIIPTLEGIDAVCTDPPYGIEDLVGGYGRSGDLIANDKNLDACQQALALSAKAAPDAWFAVFYSPRIRGKFYEIIPPELFEHGEIIWDKKAPGMGRGIRYQHETVAIFFTGREKKLHGDTFSVLQDFRSAETHPHQKPIGLIRRLCELVGGTKVLDPFMGSGTCGVACAKLKRKFVGIELDPKHFDTCCRRIEEAYKAPDMFSVPEPVQEDIFGDNDNKPAKKKKRAA